MTRPRWRTLALPAVLALLVLPVAGCSGGDDEPADADGVEGPCAPPAAGELAPSTTFADYTRGSFALRYELADGASECVVVDDAPAVGSYEVAGEDTQIYVDLGDVDLGLTVDLASFAEEGDAPLALGEVPATVGVQVDQHHYAVTDPAACTVTLLEVTADTFSGSFTCSDLPGYADQAGPFGGEPTDASLLSASGWWTATTS